MNLLNRLALILIVALTAAAPAFADDESAKMQKEYEEEVKKMYEPVNPAENLVRDTYLLSETEDLGTGNDDDQKKDSKPLKLEKRN